jgi:hypothetical protein
MTVYIDITISNSNIFQFCYTTILVKLGGLLESLPLRHEDSKKHKG